MLFLVKYNSRKSMKISEIQFSSLYDDVKPKFHEFFIFLFLDFIIFVPCKDYANLKFQTAKTFHLTYVALRSFCNFIEVQRMMVLPVLHTFKQTYSLIFT